jgi:hypothetical protein
VKSGTIPQFVHKSLKSSLLAALSKALKVALHYTGRLISYKNLHLITNRAPPWMILNYKLALQLYSTFNHSIPDTE